MSVEERLKEVQLLYEELLNSSNVDKIDQREEPRTPETSKMSQRELENSSGKIIPITERKEEYEEEDTQESENLPETQESMVDFTGMDHETKNNMIKRLILSVCFYHSKYKSQIRKFKALDAITRSTGFSKGELSPNSFVQSTSAEIQSNSINI